MSKETPTEASPRFLKFRGALRKVLFATIGMAPLTVAGKVAYERNLGNVRSVAKNLSVNGIDDTIELDVEGYGTEDERVELPEKGRLEGCEEEKEEEGDNYCSYDKNKKPDLRIKIGNDYFLAGKINEGRIIGDSMTFYPANSNGKLPLLKAGEIAVKRDANNILHVGQKDFEWECDLAEDTFPREIGDTRTLVNFVCNRETLQCSSITPVEDNNVDLYCKGKRWTLEGEGEKLHFARDPKAKIGFLEENFGL